MVYFHGGIIAHYEDPKSNNFFIQLINLKQQGSVQEHIQNFQRLILKVQNIPDDHMVDLFRGTLKDNIQDEVQLWEPKSLDNAYRVVRNVESKIMATRKVPTNSYKEGNTSISHFTQPTRLTPQQL